MMQRSGGFRYGEATGLQILELPYGNGSLSMLVFLPRQVDGVSALEDQLTVEKLQRWRSCLRYQEEVQVALPKFKSNAQFEISTTLRTMGIESAFDADAADFSGISDRRDVFLAAVLHRARVEVDKTGTEAAAATGISWAAAIDPGEEPQAPPVFWADAESVTVILAWVAGLAGNRENRIAWQTPDGSSVATR